MYIGQLTQTINTVKCDRAGSSEQLHGNEKVIFLTAAITIDGFKERCMNILQNK